MLGHADPGVTLRTYTHVTNPMQVNLESVANLSSPVVGGGVLRSEASPLGDAPLFSELQPTAGTATHKLETPP